jgi:hypothetical protein
MIASVFPCPLDSVAFKDQDKSADNVKGMGCLAWVRANRLAPIFKAYANKVSDCLV